MSVYKIAFGDNIYVGSTRNPLEVRKRGHKSCLANEKYKNKLYSFMRNSEIKDFKLELLETVSDGCLAVREEFYRKKLNANLNTFRCFITEEERLHSKNRKIKCCCGSIIRIDNINRHKKSSKHKTYENNS